MSPSLDLALGFASGVAIVASATLHLVLATLRRRRGVARRRA